MELAEKCDHRNIGEKLGLFMIDEQIGKGLPLWLPKGYAIRKKLEDYIYNIEKQNGYLHVLTPQIAKEELYKNPAIWRIIKTICTRPLKLTMKNII